MIDDFIFLFCVVVVISYFVLMFFSFRSFYEAKVLCLEALGETGVYNSFTDLENGFVRCCKENYFELNVSCGVYKYG